MMYRPCLNAHRSTEVAHVPAAMSPVALAMFVLALFMLEGAMPMAVKPYSWVGCTPVMAALLTPEFFLAKTSHLCAFLVPALSLSCCLTVARLSADEVSTPMSDPLLSHVIGMPRP